MLSAVSLPRFKRKYHSVLVRLHYHLLINCIVLVPVSTRNGLFSSKTGPGVVLSNKGRSLTGTYIPMFFNSSRYDPMFLFYCFVNENWLLTIKRKRYRRHGEQITSATTIRHVYVEATAARYVYKVFYNNIKQDTVAQLFCHENFTSGGFYAMKLRLYLTLWWNKVNNLLWLNSFD